MGMGMATKSLPSHAANGHTYRALRNTPSRHQSIPGTNHRRSITPHRRLRKVTAALQRSIPRKARRHLLLAVFSR
jgi:hypothetical protein